METFLILCSIFSPISSWSMTIKTERFLTSSVQQCSDHFAKNYRTGHHTFDTMRMPRDQFILETRCGLAPSFRDCPKVGQW